MSGAPGGRLAGRVAAITGGSKGMGRAFAEHMVAEGARVVALARPSAALDALGRALGDAVLPVACDVADGGAVRAALNRGAAHFGRLDILVNNAAITSLLKVEGASDAEIEREYRVNLLGPAFASSAAIPHLRAAGGGDIIFISSEIVRMIFPYLTLYASSKYGMEGLATGLRSELRAQGTRVTILRSGSVATNSDLRATWPADVADDFYSAAQKMGGMHFTGAPITMATMAETLVSVLSLPRDVNIDLVEARGRAPAPMA